MKKLRCLLGSHDERFQFSVGQYDVFRCNNCDKYYVWHMGVACGYWTKDIRKSNLEIRKYLDEGGENHG